VLARICIVIREKVGGYDDLVVRRLCLAQLWGKR
jgi:hypothetical protein